MQQDEESPLHVRCATFFQRNEKGSLFVLNGGNGTITYLLQQCVM